MSNSVRLHRRQPARLPRPWDSPTGVGCHFLLQCVKVKSESEVAQSSLTLRNPMDCSTPSFSVLHCLLSFLKLMSTDLVMPSNHLILLAPSPPAFSLSNEDSGLISFSMDWLDLLAVQGTLKSLLQHHNSKASILQ